ncbi:hypothetical protein ACIQU3_04480 [Streptomyces sp. NPDC101110]
MLPLSPDAPVYVPGQPGDGLRAARVLDAARVVTRRWRVRAG